MYCKNCGREINENERICQGCGLPICDESIDFKSEKAKSFDSSQRIDVKSVYPVPEVIGKKKNGWKIVSIILMAIVFVLAGCLVYFITNRQPQAEATTEALTSETSTTQTTTENDVYFNSTDEVVAACEDIPYSELMRNPAQYENKFIHFEGIIAKTSVKTESGYEYIVSLKDDTRKHIKFVFDAQNDSRLLENDEVDLYGQFVGLETYSTAIFGTSYEETIPVLEGYYVEWREYS